MTDPFQSPLEFLKEAEEVSPSAEEAMENVHEQTENAMSKLPPELREFLDELGNKLGGKAVVIGPDEKSFEMTFDAPAGVPKGSAETQLIAALARLARYKKTMPEVRDPTLVKTVDWLAKQLRELEDMPDEVKADRLLEKVFPERNMIASLSGLALHMVQETMKEIFTEEAIEKLLNETELMEGFALLCLSFFTVGARMKEIVIEDRNTEGGGPTEGRDTAQSADDGTTGGAESSSSAS